MTSTRADWSERERAWDRHYEWYAENIRPLSAWVCDQIATPGARLLDLCSGTGQPAIPLAERVGSGGRVVATDRSPGMVESLELRRRALGLDALEVRVMDAGQLDFPDQSFDGVSLACGLMFAADPAVWVREILRVSRPGARFAIVVWSERDENPFFFVGAGALAGFLPASGDPNQTGPFSLAAPGRLESVLEAGGASEFRVEKRTATFEFDSIDHYHRVFTEMGGASAHLRALSPAEQRRARTALEERARDYVDGDRVRLGVTALCASGRRP